MPRDGLGNYSLPHDFVADAEAIPPVPPSPARFQEQFEDLATHFSDTAAVATEKADAAAQSATAASNSASAAASSASAAASSASAAAGSVTTASGHATTASNAASATSALLASFRGLFLGAFANDSAAVAFASANGITISEGIIYENTTTNKFRQYNEGAWGDYDSTAQTEQAAAALSAANAALSAGSASASALTATGAASTATTQAGLAQGYATSASNSAETATTQAGIATTQAGLAADSAAAAGAAVASLAGTSSTSFSIPSGAATQSLTASTGKAWVAGMELLVTSSSTPTAYVKGQVESYNSSTGAMTLVIPTTGYGGSGTHADWLISTVSVPLTGALSSGDVWPISTPGGAPYNGATAIIENGRYVGFTIPSGQDGGGSFIAWTIPLSADQVSLLTGLMVQTEVVFEVSSTFLATHGLNDVGATSTTQTGTALRQTFLTEIADTDTSIENYIQLAGTSDSSLTHSLKVRSIVVRALAPDAYDAGSANDVMFQWQKLAIMADVQTAFLPSYDELFSGVTGSTVSAFNGATKIYDPVHGAIGWEEAIGVDGAPTFVSLSAPVLPTVAKVLAGTACTVVVTATTSADWLSQEGLNANDMGVLNRDGSAGTSAAPVSTTQNGTSLVRTYSYTFTGNEAELSFLFQSAGAASTAAARSFAVSSIRITIDPIAGLDMGDIVSEMHDRERDRAVADSVMPWLYGTSGAYATQIRVGYFPANLIVTDGATLGSDGSYSDGTPGNGWCVGRVSGVTGVLKARVWGTQLTFALMVARDQAGAALQTFVPSPASRTEYRGETEYTMPDGTYSIDVCGRSDMYPIGLALSYSTHTTILSAVEEAALDATIDARAEVLVAPGTYTDELMAHDWVDIRSQSGPDHTAIAFTGDASWSPATASTHQPILLNTSTKLTGLTVAGANADYGIHSESAGAVVNKRIELEDCIVLANGSEAIQDYLAGHSGDPTTAYGLCSIAFGCGMSGGSTHRHHRSRYYGGLLSAAERAAGITGGAIYYHNSRYANDPCVLEIDNCLLDSRADGGFDLQLQAIGSRQRDRAVVRNSQFGAGRIKYICNSWSGGDYQPANHCEWDLSGSGNSPAVFTVTDFGRALKIATANTTSAGSVAVSGTAVAALFGRSVITKSGGGGLSAHVYGFDDVSGEVTGTTLARRLGNCSVVNKTLTVVIDGGAPIDIVFNGDYSAFSDQTDAFISYINSALGSAGTASLYAVGERYRPRFEDEERTLYNASETGISMGSVVAWDTSCRRVRLMTASDAATLFAGVAWDDILPNASGRIKTAGWLPISDVLRTDSASFVLGDTFSIDAAHPGKVAKGGSQGLLSAVSTSAVQVAPK